MNVKKVIAIAVAFLTASAIAGAAAKYAAPAIPNGDVGVAKFDAGSPVATWNQAGTSLTVQSDGKYNYDDTGAFKSLEIELKSVSTNGGTATTVTSQSYSTEVGMANPGTFSVTFNGVAEPPAGQQYLVVVRLTLMKAGQVDKSYVDSKELTIPAKPNPGGPE